METKKKTAFRFIINIISEFCIIIAVLLLFSTQNYISHCSRSGVHRVYIRIHNCVCAFIWLLIRSHDHPQGSAFGEVSGLNECHTQSLKDDFRKPEKCPQRGGRGGGEEDEEEEEEDKGKKIPHCFAFKTIRRRWLKRRVSDFVLFFERFVFNEESCSKGCTC
jgi:hypothetical protein